MWHKPCRTFHPWCPCIKTRCLFITVVWSSVIVKDVKGLLLLTYFTELEAYAGHHIASFSVTWNYSPMPSHQRMFCETAVEVRNWVNNYTPVFYVNVIIYFCSEFSASLVNLYPWMRPQKLQLGQPTWDGLILLRKMTTSAIWNWWNIFICYSSAGIIVSLKLSK